MKYNPYHPHCGPFNDVNEYKSSNAIDEACRQHDIEYGKLGAKAYFRFSDADQQLLDRLYAEWPSLSNQAEREFVSGYIAFFEGKKATTLIPGVTTLQGTTER